MKTESALLIVGLRSMHGYSVTKLDGSPDGSVKSLRHQFGQIYDGNSARNSFKGMPLDHLPPKLDRRLTRAFLGVNAILTRYPIETWDDYQKISPEDLAEIETLILNMPPNARKR